MPHYFSLYKKGYSFGFVGFSAEFDDMTVSYSFLTNFWISTTFKFNLFSVKMTFFSDTDYR